jgi:SWI/SNF-related matrix-associated actin-dependent regulator of chromatin subfamily A3
MLPKSNNQRHLDGSMNYIVYHGIKRKSLKDEIQTADIVFTTYNTLVREFQQKRTQKQSSVLHEMDFYRIVLDEGKLWIG